MGYINKNFILLVTVLFIFSVFAPISVTGCEAEGTARDMSLTQHLGTVYYFCSPKENVSDAGADKYYTTFQEGYEELLFEKSEEALYAAPCFFMPQSNKIIKVIYKKDGKK